MQTTIKRPKPTPRKSFRKTVHSRMESMSDETYWICYVWLWLLGMNLVDFLLNISGTHIWRFY